MNLSHFPKKLMICGVPHKIKYVDRLGGQDELLYGQYHDRQSVIEINVGAHETQGEVWATLLHEAVHGILHVSGLSEFLDGKQEEAMVTALEYGLVGLWPQLQQKQGTS